VSTKDSWEECRIPLPPEGSVGRGLLMKEAIKNNIKERCLFALKRA
jgi:hypothetical protein